MNESIFILKVFFNNNLKIDKDNFTLSLFILIFREIKIAFIILLPTYLNFKTINFE